MNTEQKQRATEICFELISRSQTNIAEMSQMKIQSLFDDLIKEEKVYIAFYLDLIDRINTAEAGEK